MVVRSEYRKVANWVAWKAVLKVAKKVGPWVAMMAAKTVEQLVGY